MSEITQEDSTRPVKTLARKLFLIQRKIFVSKGRNGFNNRYKYRSCEDIYTALKNIGVELGVLFIASETLERFEASIPTLVEHVKAKEIVKKETLAMERLYIKSTVTATCIDTGETITCSAYARETYHKDGLDVSQVTGSATSYARKYALSAMLNLDDSEDPDGFNNEEDNTNNGSNTPNNGSNKPNTTPNSSNTSNAVNAKGLVLVIKTLVKSKAIDEKLMLSAYKIKNIDEITLLPQDRLIELQKQVDTRIATQKAQKAQKAQNATTKN